jgi:hypothetical protein
MERLHQFKRARSTVERYVKNHLAHLIPQPERKPRTYRRFGTFQRRLVTLMAHEKVKTRQHADEILQMEIQRQNRKTLRTSGNVPDEVWKEQILKRSAQLRPAPGPSLLDLHFSLRATRKVHLRHIIRFDGRDQVIAPTSRKSVTVLYHPRRKLWVLEHSPNLTWPPILGHFTL